MRFVGLMRSWSSRSLSEDVEECVEIVGRLVLLAAGDMRLSKL